MEVEVERRVRQRVALQEEEARMLKNSFLLTLLLGVLHQTLLRPPFRSSGRMLLGRSLP